MNALALAGLVAAVVLLLVSAVTFVLLQRIPPEGTVQRRASRSERSAQRRATAESDETRWADDVPDADHEEAIADDDTGGWATYRSSAKRR